MEVGEYVPAGRTQLSDLPRHVFKEMCSGAWYVQTQIGHTGPIKGTEKEHDTLLYLYISFVLSQDDLELGKQLG